jgi:hypothetical protein
VAFRPILRGARREASHGKGVMVQEVHSDGLVEFAFRVPPDATQGPVIYVGWPLNMVTNALLVADTARQLCGVPATELALDVEIRHDIPTLPDSTTSPVNLAWFKGLTSPSVLGPMQPMPLRLPLLSVGPREEFAMTAKGIMNDFLNATGQEAIGNFEVDFK